MTTDTPLNLPGPLETAARAWHLAALEASGAYDRHLRVCPTCRPALHDGEAGWHSCDRGIKLLDPLKAMIDDYNRAVALALNPSEVSTIMDPLRSISLAVQALDNANAAKLVEARPRKGRR
jgi:hypothetical protein